MFIFRYTNVFIFKYFACTNSLSPHKNPWTGILIISISPVKTTDSHRGYSLAQGKGAWTLTHVIYIFTITLAVVLNFLAL